MIIGDAILVEQGVRFGQVVDLTENLFMPEQLIVSGPNNQVVTVVTRVTEGEEELGLEVNP